jgi:hypothetical protein
MAPQVNTVKRSVAGCLQLLMARSRYRTRHEALSSGGLDTQSNAFFRTPGIEFLYSGVAIKRPSVAAILVFNSCTTSTWPLAKLKIELEKIRKELGVAAERQRKYDLLKRKVDTDALALKKLDAAITHAGGVVGRRKMPWRKGRPPAEAFSTHSAKRKTPSSCFMSRFTANSRRQRAL